MEDNCVTTHAGKKIIVDVANIAFSVARGEAGEKKAFFDNIQAAFTFFDNLATKNVFTIDFVSDASLRYQIDYPDKLENAMRDGKISQCPSHRAADCFFFEYAKKHPREVIIVSNDDFRDFPDGDKRDAVFCKYHIVLGEFLCPDVEHALETTPSSLKVTRPAEARPAVTGVEARMPKVTKNAVSRPAVNNSAASRTSEARPVVVKQIGSRSPPSSGTPPASPSSTSNSGLQQAADIILKSIQVLQANKKDLLLGAIKTQTLQFDPNFGEGRFGFRKFKDLIGALMNKALLPFTMKTEQRGLVLVAKTTGVNKQAIPSQAPKADNLTKGPTAPTTKGQPLPATKGQPLPATKGQPLPATKGQPLPATKGQPSPATKGSTAPTTKGPTAPTTKSPPVPTTKGSTAPTTKDIKPKKGKDSKVLEPKMPMVPKTHDLTAPATKSSKPKKNKSPKVPGVSTPSVPKTKGPAAQKAKASKTQKTSDQMAHKVETSVVPKSNEITVPSIENPIVPVTKDFKAKIPKNSAKDGQKTKETEERKAKDAKEKAKEKKAREAQKAKEAKEKAKEKKAREAQKAKDAKEKAKEKKAREAQKAKEAKEKAKEKKTREAQKTKDAKKAKEKK